MSTPFNYGGQALIEGVMMRGQRYMTIAVRNPQGNIIVHTEPLNQQLYGTLGKIPILRGLLLIWDALGLGLRALVFAADKSAGEEVGFAKQPVAWASIAVAIPLAIGLFFILPLAILNLIVLFLPLPLWAQHIAEGIIRLALFIGYIWGISHLDQIARVYGYHGAEHKTINAYEQNIPLIPDQVARCSVLHPRCGTAFLLMVIFISILIFALVPPLPLWQKVLSRILLIPLIAGISYEILKFSMTHQRHVLIGWLIKPGLAIQKLTTREPDQGMLEVSIAALTTLLQKET